MTEIFLLGFFAAVLLLGIRRPFLWVLLYLYVDILSPNKIGTQILVAIPMSLIAFVMVFAGWLFFDPTKRDARFGIRQALIVILMLYCLGTTYTAVFAETAWEKWEWVWKTLVFAAFLPMTLTTRLRIEAAVLFNFLALATIVVNGGIKTLFGGGGYETLRLLIDNNSGLYESSTIACAAITAIPLAWWLAAHGTIFPRDWKVKAFAAGYTFAAMLMPIGTGARTGLVCLGVFALLMIVQMKRRVLYGALMGIALVVSLPFLPSAFTARMSTIGNYQGDQSASTRVEVWKWTVDYALDNPLGGGFTSYQSNSFEFTTRSVNSDGATSVVKENVIVDESRAFHSSYFEMLGEQGWPGLGLFLLIHLLGITQMQKLKRAWRGRDSERERWVSPLALALQQAQLIYLVGALFVGIAYQPFIMLIIGLQCALWSYTRRIETAARARELRERRPRYDARGADAVTG